MRHSLAASALFLVAGLLPVRAEDAKPAPAAGNASGAPAVADLEKLVERIALFPDPLIAQILPASTYPLEIVEAARFTKDKESLAKSKPEDFQKEIDQQQWEPSVKVVAMCPDALKLLNDDLDWTAKLGEAFLATPEDLMQAIQTLRAKALASGALQDTDQQTYLTEDDGILIIPSDPEEVYVPEYNPDEVYVDDDDGVVLDDDDDSRPVRKLLRFGAGMALGAWLANDCNWGAHPSVYAHGYPHYGYAHQARLVHYGSANMMNYDQVKKKMGHIDRTKLDQKYGKFNNGPVARPRNPIARPTPYTDSQGRWQHSPEHRRGQDYKNPQAASKAMLSAENNRARLQDANRNGWGDKRPSQGERGQNRPDAGSIGSRVDRDSRPSAGTARTSTGDRPTLTESQRASVSDRRSAISDRELFGDIDRGSTTRAQSARGNASLNRSSTASRPSSGASKSSGGGSKSSGGGGRGSGGGRR